MDSGWAVVLGAVIAFLGAVVGKALQDWLSDARERARAQREDRRASVRSVLALTMELQRALDEGSPVTPDLHDRQLTAAAELALVVNKGAETIPAFVLRQWARMKKAVTYEERGENAAELVADLTAWHRGEVSSAYFASKLE